jgi:hypothetical protein
MPLGSTDDDTFRGNNPDTLIYDPRNFSPSVGSSTFSTYLLHGPQDIADVIEKRSDVFVYTTPEMSSPLIIRGGITVNLLISSDRTDTDLGARLCDVYPDGRSVIITDAMRRVRFRHGYSTEELLPVGEIDTVTIELRDLAWTVQPGHRIRIDISGSNYPRFDLNINNGGALYQPGDTLIARSVIHPGSYVTIPIQLPVSVKQPKNTIGASIYPNPVSGSATLQFSTEESGNVRYELTDLVGRIVHSESKVFSEGTHTVTIDISDVSVGMYVLRLETHKGSVSLPIIKY